MADEDDDDEFLDNTFYVLTEKGREYLSNK